MIKDFPPGKRFFVVRHAETKDNVAGVVSGPDSNTAVTEAGADQAAHASEIISKIYPPINRIVTSEMARTKKTADIICSNNGLANVDRLTDSGINERNYGIAAGLSDLLRKEIIRRGDSIDGEETKEAVKKRALEAIKRNVDDDKNVTLFVTHGGVIFRLKAAVLGGEKVVEAIKSKNGKVGNCAVYEFISPDSKGKDWAINLLTLDANKEINREPIVKGKISDSAKIRNGVEYKGI